MKTLEQINEARKKIGDKILKNKKSFSDRQNVLLIGMLNALVWAADGPDCSTLDRILADEPMANEQAD